MENPINMTNIFNHQQADQRILDERQNNPLQIREKMIGDLPIIMKVPDPRQPDIFQICLPSSLMSAVVEWYHITLGHAGVQRTYDTIKTRFMALGLYTV